MRLTYPLPLPGRMLKVFLSGYYGWIDRPLSKRDLEELRLGLEIKVAHRRTRQTYGAERLQHELAEHGVRVGICRLKRLRRKLGIRCKQRKKFKATTNSKHKLPVAQNLLKQEFKVSAPDKVWGQRHHLCTHG